LFFLFLGGFLNVLEVPRADNTSASCGIDESHQFFTPKKLEEEGLLEKLGPDAVVVHIHFGMAGTFHTFPYPGDKFRSLLLLQSGKGASSRFWVQRREASLAKPWNKL
jgi:hypothetical protein